MKKTILLFTLFASLFSINAQQTGQNINDINTRNNEIKLNALYLILGAFEATYERALNEESGLGISVFLPIDEDVSDDINYYISPYYRIYFGKKYAAGFYLEGFGMLNSVNDTFIVTDIDDPVFREEQETTTDFALGIGVGGKWITKRGLLGEIGFGIGRNLFNSNTSGEDLVGKLAISIGYRF